MTEFDHTSNVLARAVVNPHRSMQKNWSSSRNVTSPLHTFSSITGTILTQSHVCKNFTQTTVTDLKSYVTGKHSSS